MKPPLKWAGGKRSLIVRITELFPENYRTKRYHEPFFGGGAVFFELEPERGTINDVNPKLINFYKVVRDHPNDLIDFASNYRYDEMEYYKRRERFNDPKIPSVESAALLLYLNKTGFNGLYRVNAKGDFNVPYGKYSNPKIVDRKKILETSLLLSRIEIFCEDFSYILNHVEYGDICYLDPPYHPVSNTANFTEYASGNFFFDDQVRLRDICIKLNKLGAFFVLSNSDTPVINKLYESTGFKMRHLKTRRSISSKVSTRNSGEELLISNCI